MPFIYLKPYDRTAFDPDCVKYSLHHVQGKKNPYLVLYLGKHIAEDYGFKSGDKLSVGYDQDNPSRWAVHKPLEGQKGFKLTKPNKNLLRLSITYPASLNLPHLEAGARIAKVGEFDGNLLITLI